MKVAILSDTHLPRFGRSLPHRLVQGLEASGATHILHAGDWTSTLAVDLVATMGELHGVAGNNDPPELVERFGTRRVIELGGVRIGLTHGHLGPGRTTRQRALAVFDDEPGLAALVFGHSHVPLVEQLPDGRWLVNPGSPTDRRRQPQCTWALMTIEAGVIEAVDLIGFDRERAGR